MASETDGVGGPAAQAHPDSYRVGLPGERLRVVLGPLELMTVAYRAASDAERHEFLTDTRYKIDRRRPQAVHETLEARDAAAEAA